MAFIRHNTNGGGWINTDRIEVVNKLNDHGSDDGDYHAWIGDACFTIEKSVWASFLMLALPKPAKRRNARTVHADVLAALHRVQATISHAAAMEVLKTHGKAVKLSAVQPRLYPAIIREANRAVHDFGSK